jgi:formylglycine-generating enzyme required for sulfatase activity
MIRAVSALVLALCSVWLCCEPAFAAKRIALVIGNSVYERVPQLQNPVQDATAMSQMFKAAAFDAVTLKLDLKASEMRRALRDFSDDARDADIAIIYFAGHGLEIQGTNYLIPVDAVLERDIDAFDEAVPLDRLLHAMEPARQLRLVILDACRDNPFAKSMKHGSASHLVDRGLARIEQGGLASVGPTSLNTLVAFAAKAGSTAADGDARNSPFTAALIKFLPTPGLDLRKAFGFVRDEVLKVTHNQQEPFIYGSLGGNDVPLVPEPPAPQVAPDTAARDDYELASGINVVATWDSFIRKYPTGFYSDLAKAQRERLIAAKAAEDAARRAVAQKLAEEAGAAAEAERQRLAAKAIQEAKAAELARAEAAKKASEEAAKAAVAREADERQKALAEAAEAARRAAAQKRAEEAAAAEAERQRLAVEAIEKAKAAELARAEAAKKASDEAAKAAVAREADERRKALAEAAEAARRAAAKKLADEAAAAEAERQRIAASQEAKTAEIAHVEAEAKADGQVKLAALLPGNPAPGQESDSDASTAAHAGCADVSPELASLSPDTARTLSLSEECGLKPKQSFKECENCPEMVVVPAGEFLMGSSKEEISKRLAAANEGPQHKVVLTQMIAVGRFEVTRDQYAAFVDATGHQGSGRCFTLEQNTPQERENRSFLMPGYAQQGNHPAVCVSWTDAQAYVDWLARVTGKSYRLPSEAEYEYAARAGGTARYGASDDTTELCRFANGADQSAKAAGLPDDADYMDCTDGFPYTAPVGSFAQNAFGLNDLIGNVWEWTADCFAEDYRAAPSDAVARGQADCPARAVRGGDWFSTAALLRPAVRASAKPDSHYDDIGFRVVRTLAH